MCSHSKSKQSGFVRGPADADEGDVGTQVEEALRDIVGGQLPLLLQLGPYTPPDCLLIVYLYTLASRVS